VIDVPEPSPPGLEVRQVSKRYDHVVAPRSCTSGAAGALLRSDARVPLRTTWRLGSATGR
jgi:hypothetical protein